MDRARRTGYGRPRPYVLWSKLRDKGGFIGTNRISCQWVNHPEQRHKVIQELAGGGINPYRSRYCTKKPLRFHSSTGSLTDEIEIYRHFREREDTLFAPDGLKILLVGELSFNPERVLALEERGNKLYGLWASSNLRSFTSVGPLPFGHVEDLPQEGWREAVEKLKPDVIYALLNWHTVPFAHQVLINNPGIPFVWHFKEGPFRCIEVGSWSQLIDLYTLSDGQIYCNSETLDWFSTVSPDIVNNGRSFVLDGDLPKRDWFTLERSPRLSETDGKIHTVVPGRPEGIHPSVIAQLAQQDIHFHFYGAYYQERFRSWIREVPQVAHSHLHLHSYVDHRYWVSELSKYDAGWLHIFKSENEGDLHRATWNDLNYPARIPTLVSAGLPLIQYDNRGSIVSTQSLTRGIDIGIFYKDITQLSEQLHDKERMACLQSNAWNQRDKFTFDFYADALISFLRQIIEKTKATA